jgi:hypothetical protein
VETPANSTEMKSYLLNGIIRVLARNFGTTKAAKQFFEWANTLSESKLVEFYTRPGKFIEAAVWTSSASPAWNRWYSSHPSNWSSQTRRKTHQL